MSLKSDSAMPTAGAYFYLLIRECSLDNSVKGPKLFFNTFIISRSVTGLIELHIIHTDR